jgi:mxaD protein
MKRFAAALLGLALLSPAAFAGDLLVVSESIEIKKAPAEVWAFLKRFDGLKDWHPAFAKSDIVKGKDGQLGAVRQLTVKDGPSFTEELMALNNDNMSFTYNIVESPLPLKDYLSTVGVRANEEGGSIVSWSGTMRRKNESANPPEGESDAGVIKFITGAYQGGLQNLKKVLESK